MECYCGKTFHQANAFSNHQRYCKSSQQRLNAALAKAQQIWSKKREAQRRRREEFHDDANTHDDRTTHAESTANFTPTSTDTPSVLIEAVESVEIPEQAAPANVENLNGVHAVCRFTN